MDKHVIAKKLVSLREQSNKNRAKVANDNGISLSALSMYENGKRIPRDEIKRKLADYYGVSVDMLFFNPQCHDLRHNDQSTA